MPTCPKCDRFNSQVTYFPKYRPLKLSCPPKGKGTEATEISFVEKVWQCNWCGEMIGEADSVPAPQPETLAWAVIGEDGAIKTDYIYIHKDDAEYGCAGAEIVRVAIRVLDDEADTGKGEAG